MSPRIEVEGFVVEMPEDSFHEANMQECAAVVELNSEFLALKHIYSTQK